jgi:peptide/nickel transport system permease protein
MTAAAATGGHAVRRQPVLASGRRWAAQHRVFALLGKRLVLAVPLLFVVSAVSFLLVSLTPGDPARQILGIEATPANVSALRKSFGLDSSLPQQYWRWVREAVHGDLGNSLYSGQGVLPEIRDRLPVTLSLVVGSLLISSAIGIWLGIASAVRGGITGRLVDALSLIGFALPAFWIAAELVRVFAVNLRWLPATGYVALQDSPTEWLRSLIFPISALTVAGVAAIAKQTREAMLDVLGREYIRMARASGLGYRSIVWRHALKNASLPVLTVVGVQMVGMLSGTVLIETIFSLPGLGSLAVNAVLQHDLPVVQGLAVVFTLMVVVINAFVDLCYTWLNPQVKT